SQVQILHRRPLLKIFGQRTIGLGMSNSVAGSNPASPTTFKDFWSKNDWFGYVQFSRRFKSCIADHF
ncbi:hypothetical protein, partial [Pseudoalteromonas lipolytica]|uniref:hypothetical protein n=1 Tax=Pseudoalteromonas lipolytica TaxID=570156 RepID=UPI0030A43A61